MTNSLPAIVPGQSRIRREAREAITFGDPSGIEDVIVVIGGEVGVERDVVNPLLHACRSRCW